MTCGHSGHKSVYERGIHMKTFKNRTVLGILCIAVSLIICFAITPLVNRGLSSKTEIVRMKVDAKAGEEITKDMIETVEVGKYNLPDNVAKKESDVLGKYLRAEVYADDYILTEKLSDTPAVENAYLYGLNGTKQAISITINTFAEGVSGKLMSGDIVSVIVPDYQGTGVTTIPQELKYVEVIAATAKSGNDANTEETESPSESESDDEKELPSTVTLLVDTMQSELLAELEAESEMHLALVYRGDTDTAAKFIAAEDEVLAEIKEKKELYEKLKKALDKGWDIDLDRDGVPDETSARFIADGGEIAENGDLILDGEVIGNINNNLTLEDVETDNYTKNDDGTITKYDPEAADALIKEAGEIISSDLPADADTGSDAVDEAAEILGN